MKEGGYLHQSTTCLNQSSLEIKVAICEREYFILLSLFTNSNQCFFINENNDLPKHSNIIAYIGIINAFNMI